MRDDAAYLLDMLIAAQKIQQFVADVTETMFDNSALHQSAVVRELLVIGEAARFIFAEYKTQPWNIIAGMRNRLVHELIQAFDNPHPLTRSPLRREGESNRAGSPLLAQRGGD
jgi:uncharacterized protein with HEPN domain